MASEWLCRNFYARLRDDFLDGEALLSILEAQVRLGVWRRYYNEERLHSSLGYVTSAEFAARWVDGRDGKAEKRVESKVAAGPTSGG
jgi:transposase InsO family protein